MCEVIQFPDGDFKHTSYTKGDAGDFGVSTSDGTLGAAFLNDNEVVFMTPDGSTVFDRKALAEFIWVIAYFIDSEERNLPQGDLIGHNY